MQQLKRVQRRAARFVKKDYCYTTSVTGLLDDLGWLPLFERRKHSRLTVFHKALNNLSAFSLDQLSVSSRHTTASNENKFVSLPVSTDVFKYSFFPRTITNWNSLPLAVRLLKSTQSFHGVLQNSASSNHCWLSWHSGGNGWSAPIAGHCSEEPKKYAHKSACLQLGLVIFSVHVNGKKCWENINVRPCGRTFSAYWRYFPSIRDGQ